MEWIKIISLNYWKHYRDAVIQNCYDPAAATTEMHYWQNRLFAEVLKYFLPLSLFVIIPGVILSFIDGFYFLAWSEITAFAAIVIIAFVPSLSVFLRKTLFIVTIYFIAVVLLYYLGSFGPGLVYLVAAAFFSAMIFTRQEGYWSLILNAAICLLFGLALHHKIITPPGHRYNLASWTAVSVNVIVLSTVIFFLLHHLFKKLEESNRRFKMAIKATSETIWEWNLAENRMYHNDGMQEMFGYKEAEIGDHIDWWNMKIHPDDRERVMQEFTSFFEAEKSTMQTQYRFLCSNNSYKHVCNRATIAKNKQSQPAAMIGAIQDIHDMVSYISAIEQKNRELSEIAWIQSHKVRNHVATILGLSQIIETEKLDAANVEVIKGIVESCRNLDAVIQEINELATGGESPNAT